MAARIALRDRWIGQIRTFLNGIMPLLPMALLVAAPSGMQLSSLIVAGLLLTAAFRIVSGDAVAVQLMPVIAVSVSVFGLDPERAALTATATGLLILFLSFTPYLIPLMKLVPANVIIGLHTSLLLVILVQAGHSLLVLVPVHGATLAGLVAPAVSALLMAGAAWLVITRNTGFAIIGLLALTVFLTPAVLLQFEPLVKISLTIPNISDLKGVIFPYLLPEFFFSGTAATVAGIRMTPDRRESADHRETLIPRISGAFACVLAHLGTLIPAVPLPETGPGKSIKADDASPWAQLLAVALMTGAVLGASGPMNAIADHFPDIAYPAAYITASSPFVWVVQQKLRKNDVIVIGVMAALVLWTYSFGWGFVGGLFTAALVRMILGESLLSSSVKELKDL